MQRLNNVRLRFTLLYGAALIVTVVLFAAGIYWYVQNTLIGQINNHLSKDLDTVADYVEHDPGNLHKFAQLGPVEHFRILDGNRPLVASPEWDKAGLDSVAGSGLPTAESRVAVAGDQRLYRIQGRLVTSGEHLFQITVAHPEEGYRRALRALGLIIMLILPVLSASSLVIGYLISGRVLAPITLITAKAREINAENLAERLPVGSDDNEFSRLAMVFNQTFTRLEGSFERLRRFTSDASHELRTPLTAIRSIGETALQRQDVQPACREVIGSMLEETDRLVQTVESLLLLSRADSSALHKEPVDLGSLLSDVIEFITVLAEEKQQQLAFQPEQGLTMPADACMLRRAFLNLIDNAIKHTPERTTVTVACYRADTHQIVVEVADQGPGIPASERSKIFDRFYRLDNGRSREKGGTGLGLAITRAAVEAHNGSISLLENPGGGALFRVVFQT